MLVGAFAVHRNVTDQRRPFELGQRMAAMIEFSGEAIVGGELDGTIMSWNPATERLFGYAADEIIGESVRCW